MQKAIVFISHIKAEAVVATALKELIERAFIGLIDVFVSSDPSSLEPGQKWLERVTFALKNCKVEIVLASRQSVVKPWINFEAGAGWVRDIPVIPLCHSGMTFSTLPQPLSNLQAANATDEAGLKQIFPVFAKAIGSNLPAIDYRPFIQTVLEFEKQSAEIDKVEAASIFPVRDGLLPHELAVLSVLLEEIDSPGGGVMPYVLKQGMGRAGFTNAAFILGAASLTRKGLIMDRVEVTEDGPFTAVSLTAEGLAWIEQNQTQFLLKPRRVSSDEDLPF